MRKIDITVVMAFPEYIVDKYGKEGLEHKIEFFLKKVMAIEALDVNIDEPKDPKVLKEGV